MRGGRERVRVGARREIERKKESGRVMRVE